MQNKNESRRFLAVILIVAGFLWLFKRADHFPFFANLEFNHFLMPVRYMFAGIGNILFSWQMILIITGIVLIAGRRSAGIILIVLGSIFLFPEILHISFWSLSFLIPALLISAGVVLILKSSAKIN
jgi:predicted membrane protein